MGAGWGQSSEQVRIAKRLLECFNQHEFPRRYPDLLNVFNGCNNIVFCRLQTMSANTGMDESEALKQNGSLCSVVLPMSPP